MFLVVYGLKFVTEIDVCHYQDGRDRSVLIKTMRDIGLNIQKRVQHCIKIKKILLKQ
jgi:hypothetical protein